MTPHPATFTDTAGREWRLRLNLPRLRALRELLGYSPAIVATDEGFAKWRELDCTRDPLQFADVVAVLLAEDLDRAGVTRAQFEEAFFEETYVAAKVAWEDCVINFLPLAGENPRDPPRRTVRGPAVILEQWGYELAGAAGIEPGDNSLRALAWLAEGRYRGGLRLAIVTATGRDPYAESRNPPDPAAVRAADGEALHSFAALCAASFKG
jgi:hypothetical protein